MKASQKNHPVLLFVLYFTFTLLALLGANNPLWGIFIAIFAIPLSVPIYYAFGRAFAKAKLFLDKKWAIFTIQIILILLTASIGALSTATKKSVTTYELCIDGCNIYYSYWEVFAQFLVSSSILAILYHISFYVSYLNAIDDEKKKEKEMAAAAEVEKAKKAEEEAAELKALEDLLKNH